MRNLLDFYINCVETNDIQLCDFCNPWKAWSRADEIVKCYQSHKITDEYDQKEQEDVIELLNLILESKGDKDVIKACKETYDEVHVNQTWIE